MRSKTHETPEIANTQMELELYKRMHADWLLSPFALLAHILLVDVDSRKLIVHNNWRIKTLQTGTGIELPETIPFGEGVSGRAAAENDLIYEPDTRHLPVSKYIQGIPYTSSDLAVPVKTQEGKLIAVINIDSPRLNGFDDLDDHLLFKGYADQAAQVLAQTERHDLDRAISDLEVRIELAYLLEQYLRPIYRAIRSLDPSHKTLIFLADPERKELALYQSGNFYQLDRYVNLIPYGEGVTGRAALQLESVYESDTSLLAERQYVEIAKGTRSNFAVPVFVEGSLLAVVDIENENPDAFPELQRRQIEGFCMLAAPAIQTARRLHLDMQTRHFLQALQDLTKSLVLQSKKREICNLVVEKAVELTGAAFGCLQIYDYKNDNLIMLSVWPPSQRDQILKKYEIIKRGDGVTGRVAATLGPVWIPNVHQLLEPEQYLASLPNIRTELAVPLRSKSKQLAGVLNVEWDTNTRPDKLQSTRQLEALADIAVMGLSASQISESVQKRAQIGRDKLSVMTELAFGILHNSMHKISLAILNIQDAKRNIDIAGNLIESSTSVSVWKKSKDKMLDILFESDASQGQALGSLRDFQHEWDEFKSKTKDLEINTNAIKVSIEEAVRNAVEGALTRRVLNPSVDVEIQLGSLSGVLMTPSLGLILEQLINNAGESMPDGGRLKIKAQRWEDDPTFVEIQISDSGGGISPEIRPHIFEPFYSGRKEKRASRGLGLYIAQASSEASGGELELLNETIESGTTFTIRLPMDMIEQGD